MSMRAANAYRRVDLESAPKTQIVERLFERCTRDIADARTAIAAKDIHAKAAALDHAQRIVIDLKASLDFESAPELCANLAALYNFVLDRLTEANATLTVAPLDQATRIMTELGDAFRQAHAK
jgi:flagellar secretion chaperone FliS